MEKTAYLNAFNMVPYLGPRRIKSLLRYIPDPAEAWKAPVSFLQKVDGWGSLAQKFAGERSRIDVKYEWDKLQNSGIWVLTEEDPQYPDLLQEIFYPPLLIYGEGELKNGEITIAIVGSRKATAYGKEIALKFARELAYLGVTVVSGMALGIDSWAHKGALEGGGRTIAVLGSGADVCYPPQNRFLKHQIGTSGAVISEFPVGTKPIPQHFPRRNRIISGLSMGTVVVEAMEKSGALITADFALEQGREVFAVPGNINSPYSRGCNRLIKQGAKVLDALDDILEEVGLAITESGGSKNEDGEHKETGQMSFLEKEEEDLLNLVSFQPTHADEIIREGDLSPSKFSELILNLEMKGFVRQLPGKYFMRI